MNYNERMIIKENNSLNYQLRLIAKETRQSIESLSIENHPSIRCIKLMTGDNEFPKNWCDFSSCVLANQLARNAGIRDINYNSTSIGIGNHFWLEICNDIVVDITADQFSRTNESIIVESRSKLPEMYREDVHTEPFFGRKQHSYSVERAILKLDFAIQNKMGPTRTQRSFQGFIDNGT